MLMGRNTEVIFGSMFKLQFGNLDWHFGPAPITSLQKNNFKATGLFIYDLKSPLDELWIKG